MAMSPDEIKKLIQESIPDAVVTIDDLRGDGDHYSALIISESFRDMARIKQHQLVYKALKGRMGGQLHALALKTVVPN